MGDATRGSARDTTTRTPADTDERVGVRRRRDLTESNEIGEGKLFDEADANSEYRFIPVSVPGNAEGSKIIRSFLAARSPGGINRSAN